MSATFDETCLFERLQPESNGRFLLVELVVSSDETDLFKRQQPEPDASEDLRAFDIADIDETAVLGGVSIVPDQEILVLHQFDRLLRDTAEGNVGDLITLEQGAVDVDATVLDHDGLARQSDDALHVPCRVASLEDDDIHALRLHELIREPVDQHEIARGYRRLHAVTGNLLGRQEAVHQKPRKRDHDDHVRNRADKLLNRTLLSHSSPHNNIGKPGGDPFPATIIQSQTGSSAWLSNSSEGRKTPSITCREAKGSDPVWGQTPSPKPFHN